jgi:mono/diheme cytochrome c family protein
MKLFGLLITGSAALIVLAGAIVAPAGLSETQMLSDTLRRGQRIYEANCAVCHGERGDGKGEAAHMLVTQPRDFRPGWFKFRSTASGALPSDDDIMKTVTNGVRWTAMVGRADLSEPDRRAVVQYLKTFSPRFAEGNTAPSITVPAAPGQSKNLLEVGRHLFQDAECAKCHGMRADGKGESSAELIDDWGNPLTASDLTWRPLKRGSAPRDVYLTIATGLNGTPMPAYATALDSEQIWALVYHLESLVPKAHRLSPQEMLGEEQRGWMILRMQGMMGHGMMQGR